MKNRRGQPINYIGCRWKSIRLKIGRKIGMTKKCFACFNYVPMATL